MDPCHAWERLKNWICTGNFKKYFLLIQNIVRPSKVSEHIFHRSELDPKKREWQPPIRNCCPEENFCKFLEFSQTKHDHACISSNKSEARRLALSQQETLNILQFYGSSYDDPRQEADNSFGLAWMSWPDELKRKIHRADSAPQVPI